MKIEINDGNVITLETLAERYGRAYGVKAEPDYENDRILFETDEGDRLYVDASGFARRPGTDERAYDGIGEYDAMWSELLDVPDIVWAHDLRGRLVALSN